MIKTLAYTLLLTGLAANAGQERGGTTAIVCFEQSKNPKETILPVLEECLEDNYGRRVCSIPNKFINDIVFLETIDYYEAKMNRTLEGNVKPVIIEIAPNESFRDYLIRLSNRMVPYVSEIADVLSHGLNLINDFNVQNSEAALPPVLDLGVASVPDKDNCIFTTMVVQQGVGYRIQTQVDTRLMNHKVHSRQSQASAWIHEPLYAYARTYKGHADTHGTRLASKILTTQSPTYTVGKIVDDLINAKMLPLENRVEADGYLLDGRMPGQSTSIDTLLPNIFTIYLDRFEDQYTKLYFLNDVALISSFAINDVQEDIDKLPHVTPAIVKSIRQNFQTVMIMKFNTGMISKNAKDQYELSEQARRQLTTGFFRSFSPFYDILIQ